jgi:hypothetical protein
MDEFDGDAISRADREFLASLVEHPLKQSPQYGAPCPPRPDFGPLNATDPGQTAARLKHFEDVVTWMLANYAYREGAFVSKGGAISLVDGEIIALADLRGRMAPWALIHVGPRGGIKVRSPVEDWMLADAEARRSIRREETRPDRPRPTFVENGYAIFNRYRPPAHPARGGEIEAFEEFFAHLVPDETERKWLWHWLAHKARRPWVPMVAVIMVAEDYGSGRGTLFDILGLLFGEAYVVPCAFTELTGTSASARFNARMANALIAVINEAVDEDGHQQAQRRLAYEALKNAIDPSPTARRRFEEKYQHVTTQRSAMSAIIATQHRDVVKLPRDDRRFCVITCGGRLSAAQTAAIRAWMAVPENVGALYRALQAAPAVPIDVFNPFDYPPPFAGRLEMIGMAKSAVEDAYEAAIAALEGFPLFTLSQMLKLIGYFGGASGGEGSERAKHTVTKNAYRLRGRDEPYNRIRFQKRQEILYARTERERQSWRPSDKEMIVATLKRTEERIVHVINTGDGADQGQLHSNDNDSAAAAAAAAVMAAIMPAGNDGKR